MLEALRFVQGAVARKDFVPVLTHFYIKDGRIKGYNGRLGLCSPVPLDLNVCPKAAPLVKAVQTCQETVTMHVTPAGRLAVKSGKFKAFIECVEEEFPALEPAGDFVDLPGDLLIALKLLFPFISEDASRPWSRGILIKEASAYATNNVVLVQHWLGQPFPFPLFVPHAAVQELLRINEEPVRLQVSGDSITFHYEGERWLKTSLYDASEWPDVSTFFAPVNEPQPFPPDFFKALEDLLPFVNEHGRVYVNDALLTTCPDGQEDSGAAVEMPGMPAGGIYQIKYLRMLSGLADSFDFGAHPKPAVFYGKQLRGVIIGMRG